MLKSLLDGVRGEAILPGVWSSRRSLLSLLILDNSMLAFLYLTESYGFQYIMLWQFNTQKQAYVSIQKASHYVT